MEKKQIDEIKDLVEGVNKSFADLKTEQDALKGKVDSLDEKKIDRIADDVASKLEEIQKQNAKIEAALSRTSNGETESKKEDGDKAKSEFKAFMRGDSSQTKMNIFANVEEKAMSTDVNPDGGYLVRPELANFVVDRVFESSPMRQVARVVTIGTNTLDVLIDDDQAAARWVAEGASGGSTATPKLGMLQITAQKLEADPRITTEQMQDSYLDVEAWLQGKVADIFSRTENTAFMSGNGVGKPRGILDYAAWATAGTYERNKLEQINLGATATLTSDGLIGLQGSLKEKYQANASFLMKRDAYTAALKLKGNDQYFFGQTLLKDGNMGATLLGKNVLFADDMQAVGANNLALAYGDFGSGYTIADRIGLSILRDPFTNKGFITFYTTKRTGGAVTNFDAIKIGKVAV